MISELIKKIFGIKKLEEDKQKAEEDKQKAIEEAEQAKEKERIAKLTPKEIATEKKEPWVAVINTHVNQSNLRNGFFELDWNEYFVLQLRNTGFSGETEEQVVDAWFSELCRTLGNESGIDMDRRGSGYVNRALRDDGRTEIG